MRKGPRLALAIVTGIAVHYFVYWVPSALLIPTEHYWLASILSLAAGIAAGRYVWQKAAAVDKGVGAYALSGALIVGGIGFVGGFFGPILLGGGNQGPLLGLFITGPLGFLLGAIGGVVYGLRRKTEAARS